MLILAGSGFVIFFTVKMIKEYTIDEHHYWASSNLILLCHSLIMSFTPFQKNGIFLNRKFGPHPQSRANLQNNYSAFFNNVLPTLKSIQNTPSSPIKVSKYPLKTVYFLWKSFADLMREHSVVVTNISAGEKVTLSLCQNIML